MKKLSFLAFAGALFFLASCEDDDTPKYVQPNYLAGQWNVDQIGTMNSGNLIDYVTVDNGNCSDDNIIFNEDGTFSESDYTPNGEACDVENINGTYALNQRSIQLSYTDPEDPEFEGVAFSVLSLTHTDMEVSFTDPESHQIVFLKLRKQELQTQN